VSESQSKIKWPDTKVYVAGHRGLVGSALVRALEAQGAGEIVGWTSSELDLRDREAAIDAVNEAKPDIVIDAAARVGGIMANSTYPVDFLNGRCAFGRCRALSFSRFKLYLPASRDTTDP